MIVRISAGWNHSLALTDKGDLFACGYGQFGQLGLLLDFEIKNQFHHVFSLAPRNVQRVFAGGNHSWVVLDDMIPVKERYRAPSPPPEVLSASHSPADRQPRGKSNKSQGRKE